VDCEELGRLVIIVEDVLGGLLVMKKPVEGFAADGLFVTEVRAAVLILLLVVMMVGRLVEEEDVVVSEESGPSTITVGAGLEVPCWVVIMSYDGPTTLCELVMPVEKPGRKVVYEEGVLL
jgi:hypothetical protein